MEDNLKDLKNEYKEKKKEASSFSEKRKVKHDYREMKKMLKGANKLIKDNDLMENGDEFWDKIEFPKLDEFSENNIEPPNPIKIDDNEPDKDFNKIDFEQKEKINKLISDIDKKIQSLERKQANEEIEKVQIDESNINEISYQNIKFITIAEGGAMGHPGEIELLTNNLKMYRINPFYNNVPKELVEKLNTLCPLLDEINHSTEFFDKIDPQWNYLNMGMGNHLFIRKEIYNSFKNIYQKKFPDSRPGILYQNWLVIAFDLFTKENPKPKEENNKKDKIRGSLIGGAIGDALGYQIEFRRGITDKEITKFNNDKGIISDDTQMSLFTANALLWRETRGHTHGIAPKPAQAIYEAYLDWLDTQNNTNNHNSISWIKNIPELNIERAPGNTCLGPLSSGKMGTIEEPINNSKGCGGIMRVAPIGLYANNSINAGIIGVESSSITHGHPLGIIPCYLLASMLNMIVNNNDTIESALTKSVHQYYDEFNRFDKKDMDYQVELINKAIKLSKENISDVEAISSLGEGWVAEETFAIAIYSCLKYQNSFEDAIICSVNHDGDSDSTGAVAGNIMGAYLGYSAIPDYYKNNVELKNVILELADDMSVKVPISEYSSNKDEKWENKYLYCKYSMNSITFNEALSKAKEYAKKVNKTIVEASENNEYWHFQAEQGFDDGAGSCYISKKDGVLIPIHLWEPEVQELNAKFSENSKPLNIE